MGPLELLADIYAVLGFICRVLGLKSQRKKFREWETSLRAEVKKLDAERRRQCEEADRLQRQRFFDDPELNTQDWELHKQRLSQCGASRYDHCSYYVGPRGGVYYINSRGRKTYC